MSFSELGLDPLILKSVTEAGYETASPVQVQAIPAALTGRDLLVSSHTGSGKTAAFLLPSIQRLLAEPAVKSIGPRVLVLAPTRELALQVEKSAMKYGKALRRFRTACLVGGAPYGLQLKRISQPVDVVVATPGRLIDHLERGKIDFSRLEVLVLDEADRMLSLDFEEAINTILASLPRDRHTYLFSATMTSKVAKLQRASLRDPVRVEVSSKYTTVSTLVQQYVFVPAKWKEAHLVYLLNEFAGQSGMIFVSTCAAAQRTTAMLDHLGFRATCLHGQMSQAKRLGALNKFKSGSRTLLVATDVAARGLDIPAVDLVVNFDVPSNGKDYIHRVGRTARAGRAGRAITFVTQYDIELYQRIEHLLGTKLEAFPVPEEAVLMLTTRVAEALRLAAIEMREAEDGGGGHHSGAKRRAAGGAGGGDDGDNDDTAAAAIVADSERRRRAIGASIRAAGKHGGGGGGGRGGHRRR